MGEEEICNTTLGLGPLGLSIGVERREKTKQKSKRVICLDLSLPLHPKKEAIDDDREEEEEDDGCVNSKNINDQEEYEDKRNYKRSDLCSNDEKYNSNNNGSRKKLKLTKEQITLLEHNFKTNTTLNTGQKQVLAERLNLLPRQIEVWFQNRRARTKLKQIEVECNFLKKCSESLNDENRRLKKELQELRSLKLDEPLPQPPLLYIQFPNAAMCPSCDRFGKSGGGEANNKNGSSPMVQLHDYTTLCRVKTQGPL